MLEGQDILCFAPERWEGVWRNRHQIMSRLARRNRVLFVEPRPYLRDVLGLSRLQRLTADCQVHRLSAGHGSPAGANGGVIEGTSTPRANRRQPRLRHVCDGLYVYRPPRWAPLTGRQPLKALTDALRRCSLLRAMARLGMREPILWLFRPDQVDVVGRYGERLVLYHVVDEYTAYEKEFVDLVGAERLEAMAAMERSLLRRADLVIVTSPVLLEAKRPFNPHTYLVRNGVDYAAFSAALSDPSPPPEDIAALPPPVIGYVGVINEKIDLGLLRAVARAHPEWSLAVVGPITLRFHREQLAWLELPNVHLLGFKPVEQLPRYIAACQVCLMPYKVNEWTRHIDPLKMYEYLAAGRPVVSTDIPSARTFAPPLRIAHDVRGFVSEIEAALVETDDAQREAFRRLASQHTWEARVEELSTHIEAALTRTSKSKL